MSEIKEQPFYNQVSNELVHSILKEKRAERRWKNLRFLVWIALILAGVWFAWSSNYISVDGDYVALIRLNGTIDPDSDFSGEVVVPALKQAFADEHAKGVVLDINSGGGTPVQAAIIHDAIAFYKKKYHKKTIVVGEDFLASGAYYIAVAADQIYVNPNTLTGSIGAIIKGFGFTELLKKVGIERRVYMSGNAKDRLDPFLPETANDQEKAKQMLSDVQANFTHAVLAARRNRLHGDPALLFNGDFWSGTKALELGLVDGLGNLMEVTDKEFKATRYRDYSPSSSLFNRVASSLGTSLGTFLRMLG